MAECYRCPYTTKKQHKFGTTTHCNLEPTKMDVSYYCMDEHKDENKVFSHFSRREDALYLRAPRFAQRRASFERQFPDTVYDVPVQIFLLRML